MNQDLNGTTKKIADALIDISANLNNKMDSWSNIVVGEGSLQKTERAGFVNKTSADSGIDMVIDVHAVNNDTEATLRTWALDDVTKDDGTKVFNNIQLTFTVTYEKARELTERFDTVTRDDIRSLLHETDTALQTVVVSNRWKLDETTRVLQGQYYDVSANEVTNQEVTNELCNTLETVLEALQRAADTELR